MMRRSSPPAMRPGAADAPPRSVEWIYYVLVVYGQLGATWGLGVSGLAGGGLALLAVCCVLRLGPRAATVYRPIRAPLACAAAFIAVQLVVHGESIQDLRPYVVWLVTLIVVHSLALREGFLRRFVGVAFLLGLSVLPYLTYMDTGHGVERARLDRTLAMGGMGNSNDLAAWFGFCAVFCVIAGIETRRTSIRVLVWLASALCVFMVSLTVSRGSLMAIALAALVIAPRLGRRGLLPAACLAVVAATLYLTGTFDDSIAAYLARGTEETGRLLVWPLALARFLSSPITGVGMSNVAIAERLGHEITPHNSFLYVGLAAGIVPLLFFVSYWLGAARAVLHRRGERSDTGPYRLPLFLYALAQAMLGNVPFMSPWMIVVLTVVRLPGWPRPAPRSVHLRGRRPTGHPRLRPLPVSMLRLPAARS